MIELDNLCIVNAVNQLQSRRTRAIQNDGVLTVAEGRELAQYLDTYSS
jgi:hypothetical protein